MIVVEKSHLHIHKAFFVQARLNLMQRGFSLVELMVGLIIGLIVTLVIMQVFSVFEGQKRTTSGTADAQTNGNISIYSITRDLQLAGYGLPVMEAANSSLSCPISSNLSPVLIADGGGGASDSITVRYGSSDAGGFGTNIIDIAQKATGVVGVQNNMGCHVGDTALFVNGASCTTAIVQGPTDIAVPPVSTGDTTHLELDDASAVALGSKSSCLGNWQARVYSVNALNQLDLNGNGIASDIVNIQAQYGVSATAKSNVVTEWVNASGDWAVANLTPSSRNRIKALRVAIVARNGLKEKALVSSSCTTVKGTVNTGPCAWDDTAVDAAPQIDLSNLGEDWANYRYRVYETTIPIRNIIWSNDNLL